MIPCFPHPYKDELLYSACARYCAIMDFPAAKTAGEILFSTRNSLAVVDLPGYLGAFVRSLARGHSLTVDRLLDNHTLLPYHGAFLPIERLLKVRTSMSNGGASGIPASLGIVASRVVPPQHMRFCPACVQEDRCRLQECYWHRLHQVPGVLICPKHKVYLENSGIAISNRRNRLEYTTAEGTIPIDVVARKAEQDKYFTTLYALALDAEWVLDHKPALSNPEELRWRTSALLARLGLVTPGRRVRSRDLTFAFEHKFPADLLDRLGCKLDYQIATNWLVRMLAGSDGSQHSLYRLLLLEALGSSAKEFFRLTHKELDPRPFGEGPWPCLNVACNHYGQLTIKTCLVTHHWGVGKPIGHFQCNCGFTYRRSGPDQSESDRYKYTGVDEYGEVWRKRLGELWQNASMNINSIARALAVHKTTARAQAKRLGLQFPAAGLRSKPYQARGSRTRAKSRAPISEIGDNTEAFRAAWLQNIENSPACILKVLKSRSPLVHYWLKKNDNAWLAQHSPSGAERTKVIKFEVDWEERDAELSALIAPAAERIRGYTARGRPVMVTVSEVGREIGERTLLQKRLDKLPLTAAALTQVIETRVQFALRRIKWFTERCLSENRYPTRSFMTHRLYLEDIIEMPEVSAAVDNALRSFASALS